MSQPVVFKQFGKTVNVIVEGKTYAMTGEKEQRDSLIELINKANAAKSDTAKKKLLDKIFKLTKAKEEKAKKEKEKEETKLKGEKTLVKKAIKKEKIEKSHAVAVVNDLEDSLKEDLTSKNEELLQKNSELENKNKELEERIRKLEEMQNKASNMPVPASTVAPVPKRKEY